MKDIFYIEVPDGERFALALDLLSRGLGFVFDDVLFARADGELSCEALSASSEPTELAARHLIEHARAAFDYLCVHGKGFRAAVSGLVVRLRVIHDYGMGTAVVCEMIGDRLSWTRT